MRYGFEPACEQPSWPQVHMISVLSAMPSQWALQYFSFSGGTQLQAGFAHFFVPAIVCHVPDSTTRLPSWHPGIERFRCRVTEKGMASEATLGRAPGDPGLRDKLEGRSKQLRRKSCLIKNTPLSPCMRGSILTRSRAPSTCPFISLPPLN